MNKRSLNRELGIENVFYVNLDSKPLKKEKTENLLTELNIDFQRFDAVDSGKMNLRGSHPYLQVPGGVGCCLSHWLIFRKAVENQWDSVMVFEDDLVPHKDYWNKLDSFLNEVPNDWTFIWLGWGERNNKHREVVSSMVAKHDDAIGTHAYCVRGKDTIRKVYDRLTVIENWPDILLSEMTRNINTAYKTRQSLFSQDYKESDLHPQNKKLVKPIYEWAERN